MNQAHAECSLPRPSRLQVAAADATVLTRIYDANVNLAVWQRSLPPEVNSYADWLLEQHSPLQWHEVIALSSVASRADKMLPAHANKAAFIHDFCEVLQMFCCLFELDGVGLRLRVLDKAMCPKFHTDRVPCRLITTFGGAGTEWLPECAPNSPATEAQRLQSGDVALLKGDAWQGNEGLGLVHRSPALRAGQKRLLLTLDFA